MRIHTTATWSQLHGCLPDGVSFEEIVQRGSRTSERAFEVRLTGSGYAVNTGHSGAGSFAAATWDEWGAFLGALYALDSDAVCGGSLATAVYRDAEHYHWSTNSRFYGGDVPSDTHKRHAWDYQGTSVTGTYSVQSCKRCSAVMRRVSWGHRWEEELAS